MITARRKGTREHQRRALDASFDAVNEALYVAVPTEKAASAQSRALRVIARLASRACLRARCDSALPSPRLSSELLDPSSKPPRYTPPSSLYIYGGRVWSCGGYHRDGRDGEDVRRAIEQGRMQTVSWCSAWRKGVGEPLRGVYGMDGLGADSTLEAGSMSATCQTSLSSFPSIARVGPSRGSQ
jgi:hypothetical protein